MRLPRGIPPSDQIPEGSDLHQFLLFLCEQLVDLGDILVGELLDVVLGATLLVFQAFVYRFYRAPFDVQVAATTIHAWRDVEPVLVRALPSFFGATAVVAAIEYLLLVAAKRERVSLRLVPVLAKTV